MSLNWFNQARALIELDKFDFAFEYSCSVLYLCSKKSRELNDNTNADNTIINENLYKNILIKSLNSVYRESNWSSILLNYLFKEYFLSVLNQHYFNLNNFKIRIKILKLLNNNLDKITQNSDFLNISNFYESLSIKFLNYLDSNTVLSDLKYLNNLMYELKLILIVISDLLSSCNENDDVNDRINGFRCLIQNRELVVRNTCHILNKIHSNGDIKKNFDANRNNDDKFEYFEIDIEEENEDNGNIDDVSNKGWVNLKLELIRLIGILVYENEFNRNIIQETKALITIIENVNIDINNPFIREWSIVTLRHLYYAKEIKN